LKGIVFDIQRFSVHDGPGIRTTVFMKGCPLRCRWCHNPEGLLREPQLQFFEEDCIKCGACGKRKRLSDAAECPSGALRVCGREMSTEEVMREIKKDIAFYGSEGGVTLSGGECLMQADFTSSILREAKAEGLSTAADTSGCADWSAFEKTLPFCDLYLYDVKCVDSSAHKEYTGADNSLIIENLKKLAKTGKEIWIRVPVIPGFNDSEKEMDAISDLVSSLPRSAVTRVTLMPYHTLGASKYKTLGKEYPFDTSKRISDSSLLSFTEIFRSKGMTVC